MVMPSVASLIGPWEQALDPGERKARLRSMRAVCGCMLGWKHQLVALLGRAEADPTAAICALAVLEALPSRTRRHVWCSYLATQPKFSEPLGTST